MDKFNFIAEVDFKDIMEDMLDIRGTKVIEVDTKVDIKDIMVVAEVDIKDKAN